MRKVLLILSGLTLLGALTYFCFQDKIENIRQDLEGQTNTALLEHDIDYAHAKLKGVGLDTTSTIRLTGIAPSQEAKETAAKVAAATVGVMGIENWLTVEGDTKEQTLASVEQAEVAQKSEVPLVVAPKIEKAIVKTPYIFDAQKYENGHILLDGYVNSNYEHQVLLTEAEKLFGKENLTDNLKIKNGAPNDWNKVASLGVSKLSSLDYGTLHLKDNDYNLQGYIKSKNASKRKESLLQDSKQELANYSAYAGKYDIDIEEEKAPKEKIVEKVIPTKKEIVKEQSPKVEKEQSPKIAKNKNLKSIQDCQKALSKLSKQQKIYFEYNKATVQQKSIYALDNIIKVLHNCNMEKIKNIEIGGHTDSIGTASYNQKLSQKRATSVKNYLIKKGINKNKLKAVGYGEKKPIVSNMLKAGRAKNRRIEFKIKGVK